MSNTKKRRVYFTAWGEVWSALAKRPSYALANDDDPVDAVKHAIARRLGGYVGAFKPEGMSRVEGYGVGGCDLWQASYQATICRGQGRVLGTVYFCIEKKKG